MLDRDKSGMAQQHIQYAQHQYPIALREAQKLVESASLAQVHRVLIMCLLFVVWENMQGSYSASQKHMNSCRVILARFRDKAQGNMALYAELDEISNVLARFDISAISFSDGRAPRPPEDVGTSSHNEATSHRRPFKSVQDATSQLMKITRKLFVISNEGNAGHPYENSSNTFSSRLEEYSRHLGEWEVFWALWKAENSKLCLLPAALNVSLWHATTKTAIDAGVSGPESRFDDMEEHFLEIVQYAEALRTSLAKDPGTSSFSLDLGYIVPMAFAATRCRSPNIRHHAVQVLRSTPRCEGAWQSIQSAMICDTWKQVEEQSLGKVTRASQIPEDRRISVMDLHVLSETHQARLVFQLSGRGPNEVLERIIPWDST